MKVEPISSHLTPLLVKAAAAGDLRTLQVLLEAGAEVGGFLKLSKDSFPGMPDRGWCALAVAAYEGHEEVVDTLLRAGAEVDASLISDVLTMRSTPQEVSAASGGARMLSCVSKLAARCNSLDDISDGQFTPLRVACNTANPLYVGVLLAAGADPAAGVDASGRLPIHGLLCNTLARDDAIAKVLDQLLAVRADLVNAGDNEGVTPLAMAARSNRVAAVSRLIEHGADATLCDIRGRTCLDEALDWGHADVAVALIEAGAPLEVPEHRTPYLLRLVLESQPGKAPMMTVISNGIILRAMLAHGVDTSRRGVEHGGGTPLHWAAVTNNLEFARDLVEAGANPMAVDARGRTPQDWLDASPRQLESMSRLLREAASNDMARRIDSVFGDEAESPLQNRKPMMTL